MNIQQELTAQAFIQIIEEDPEVMRMSELRVLAETSLKRELNKGEYTRMKFLVKGF